MASIHETTLRGKPVWVAQQSLTGADGKRLYIRGYGSTAAEARRRMAQNLSKRLHSGTLERKPRSSVPTLSEAVERWLEHRQADGTQASTIAKYRNSIDNHVAPYFGGHRLDELTEEALLDHFHEDLIDSGTGSSAREHAYTALRAALNHAIKRGHIATSPLALVPKPKHQSAVAEDDAKYAGKRGTMTRGLLKWIAQEDNPYRQHLPMVLFLFLGLRRSELLGLSWSNVRQLNRRGAASIVISQQLAHRARHETERGFYIKPTTKSGKPRSIPLPETWRKALIEQRKRNLTAKNPAFSDLVFLHPTGALITWDDLARLWKDIQTAYATKNRRKQQDGDTWRLHANRHISASILLELGAPIEAIQQILGHSDTAQALHYSHASRRLKTDALDKLENAFS